MSSTLHTDELAHSAIGRTTLRVAIVCDLVEEQWGSMDLVAVMIEKYLRSDHGNIRAVRLCPPMRRRFARASDADRQSMFNADRLINRFWDYPRWLRMRRSEFDVFHVV